MESGHRITAMRKMAVSLRIVLLLLLLLIGKASFGASTGDAAKTDRAVQVRAKHDRVGADAFWSRTNLALFGGIAVVRLLDYTSTRDFRKRGVNEWLLSNSIVDNKPLFAGIEVAGIAASVGISYLLHRTGHHKLEHWVSILHISAGSFGDTRNYTLASQSTLP